MLKQILSCDWGTTSFRLRLLDVQDKKVLAETTGGKGIAAVYNEWLQSGLPEAERKDFYAAILQTQIQKLDQHFPVHLPLIISGMASSTIGMQELPYATLPFDLSKDMLPAEKIIANKKCTHDILLLSGLKTTMDVLRGEETMLMGCDQIDGDGIFIFPGTHSKHVIVEDGVVNDFKTYMTGEVFDLLANKSVLSKSVKMNDDEHYQHAFADGVKQAADNNLLNLAFHVRTNDLFKKYSPAENYHFLSGLTIGYELKEVNVLLKTIVLVCSEQLSPKYLQALKLLLPGNRVVYLNADEALIKAHCRIAAAYYA